MADEEASYWRDDARVWFVGLAALLVLVFAVLFGASAWKSSSQDAQAVERLRAVSEQQGEALAAGGSYQPSADPTTVVVASADGWAALTQAGEDRFFMNASSAPEPVEVKVRSLYKFDVAGGPSLPRGVSMWELVSDLLAAQNKGGFYTKFTLAGDDPRQTVFEVDPDVPNIHVQSVEWEIAGLQRACATVTITSDVANAPWRVRMSGASADGFPHAYTSRDKAEFFLGEGYGFVDDWFSIKERGYMRNIVGVLTSNATVSPDSPRSFRICGVGFEPSFPQAQGEAVEVEGGWELRTSSPFPRVVTAVVPTKARLSPECLTEQEVEDGTMVISCSNRPVAEGDPLLITR